MLSKKCGVLVALASLFLVPLAVRLPLGLPAGFAEFPPLVTFYPEHAPFSWTVFLLFAALGSLAMLILVCPTGFGFKGFPRAYQERLGFFPWWGYVGLTLNVLAWIGAWHRFTWMGFLRDHTFFPLWLGYILVIDGLVFRRRGHSLLSRSTITFLTLFPVSAGVWWYFEFINRFMQNWWYAGVDHFSPMTYCISASLSFSTVLPAIFETSEWLSSHAWFREAYARGPALRAPSMRAVSCMLVGGIVALALLCIFVEQLFFLAWLAPLIIVACALTRAGIQTPFHTLAQGNYARLMSLAAAALICGFFWEMWNSQSMPKWHYSVPYVTAYRVFEMPIVGYGGYVPFGPECWCLWVAVRALLPSRFREKLYVSDLLET